MPCCPRCATPLKWKNHRVGKLSRLPELSEVRGSYFYSEVSAGRVSATEDFLEETVLRTDVCRIDALFHEPDQSVEWILLLLPGTPPAIFPTYDFAMVSLGLGNSSG